ncbi:MAG: FKBP-type peptidyl-prolyl cis-trans isomerase [Ilumatobacteraceae bacterium]
MGTAKRDRQKANRHQRLLEEAKAERTNRTKRNLLRGTAAVVAAIGAVVLIAWVGGAFDSSEVAAPITDPASSIDTGPTETFPALPKPEVQIPSEIPEELQVTVLSEGDGPAAAVGDTVVVNYVGVRSADGTEFDNSYDGGQTFPVTIGQTSVIEGWTNGLVGAQAGSQIQLDIPSDLAYGDNPQGDVIQAGDALTFVIDVMSVTKADS